MLVVPLVCRKIHVPSIVGLILTGVVIGPFGLSVIDRTPAIDTFCYIGILYIMFLSGVEIDMDDFRLEIRRSVIFGVLTFLIPFLLGLIAGWSLSMPLLTALLFASIFASHTLVTWPVVSRYGVQRDSAVSVSVGATVFAVTGAMLILAATKVAATHELGANDNTGMAALMPFLRMAGGGAFMLVVIFAVMPRLAKWFFYSFNDVVTEWVFVVLLAATGGALAWIADIEPILGVFLTALALNRHIPHLSPLMSRVRFVGNAVFVPVFLLGVGMLIDLRVLANGWYFLLVAAVMVVVALSSKWFAAFAAQRLFCFSKHQRRLMYGLTNAHAAGALATVTVGYSVIMSDGARLLPEEVLNGTVLVILFSCAISSFFTEQASSHMSLNLLHAQPTAEEEQEMQLLIPVANPANNRRLVELAVMLLSRHPESRLHAAAVIRSNDDYAAADRLLRDTAQLVASADHTIALHRQRAVNVPNGISAVVHQRGITHVVMGLAPAANGYGKAVNPLVALAGQQFWLCALATPLSEIRLVRVLVPAHAETEFDYGGWQMTVGRLVEKLGAETTRETVTDWTILSRIANTLSAEELLVIVQARRSTASYSHDMELVPDILRSSFQKRNVIVLFPAQQVEEEQENPLLNEYSRSSESTYSFIRRLTDHHGT